MRLWRTWPARTRAATLAGIGVIAAGVVVLGLTHHTPPIPQVVHGPARLFSSPTNEGHAVANSPAKPGTQSNAVASAGYRNSARRPLARNVLPARSPEHAVRAGNQPKRDDSVALSALAARFPMLAHQALAADPAAGSETQYFARLGNILNGTPMPAGQSVPADADHLAHAQVDLDRGDLAAAIGETKRLSGSAASVMATWGDDAEAQLSHEHGRAAPKTVVAQNRPRPPAWPHVMPTEIPAYARESSGPAE